LINFHALYDLELWKHTKLFFSADVLNLTLFVFKVGWLAPPTFAALLISNFEKKNDEVNSAI